MAHTGVGFVSRVLATAFAIGFLVVWFALLFLAQEPYLVESSYWAFDTHRSLSCTLSLSQPRRLHASQGEFMAIPALLAAGVQVLVQALHRQELALCVF